MVPLTHLQLMCHPRTCTLTNGFQQPVCSAPSVFPAESASGKSQLCSKQSSNKPSPENFLTIGVCFECYTYHVAVLGWMKKEEERKKERKKEDEQILLSTVSGLPL